MFEVSRITDNIGDKESSSDLETGAEPHRLELEEEFGEFLQENPFKSLLYVFSARKNREATVVVTKIKNAGVPLISFI